jgi:hypothetical protein
MLRPMTAGSEVVEDYGHVGLTLRSHPIAFLRAAAIFISTLLKPLEDRFS